MAHNPVIMVRVRQLLTRASHARDTRQWGTMRDAQRQLHQTFKLRHLSTAEAIERLQRA